MQRANTRRVSQMLSGGLNALGTIHEDHATARAL